MPDPLDLRVLGTASLSAGGPDGSTLFGPGKPLALITYLALSPQRSATREHLADLLWADAEPERARRNLRQTVFLIRSLLGDEALVGTTALLTLAASIRIDRDDFLDGIERGDLLRAAELYAGPFFPAFAAPGGAEFEHWADLERRRLHAMLLRALEASVREALSQQRHRDAIALARRLRDAAPEREGGWRLLLEALISAGDWFQAATESDACETMLRDQERQAEPATLAVLRAARQSPAPAGPTTQIVSEMVGREAEFATLIGSWGRATQSRMVHVHVTGVAGIGKTRLLGDAAARVAAIGGRVVSLRANQGERELPNALAGDLARALSALPGATAIAPATAGVLLSLDPSLSARYSAARHVALGDDAQRLRTLALADLLMAVADEHPVALLCDDLHWVDAASRQALAGLATRCVSSRVLLVTSSRPSIDGSLPGRPDETITLRPLSAGQVGMLMESIAVIPDGLKVSGFVPALHAATEGSPLLVLETLHLALDHEWLTRSGDAWHGADPAALMASLRAGSAIEHRLDALEPAARRILLELAVAGGPVADPVVEATLRQSADGAAVTLQGLERLGFIVRRDAGAWDVAHDVISERLLARASREELRAAHLALGHALADTAITAERMRFAASHLAKATDSGALNECFRRYARSRRRDGDRRSAASLALDVLGEHATPAERKELVRALPIRLRIARHVAWAATVLVTIVGASAGYLWLSAPVRIVLRQQPRFASDAGGRRPLIVEAVDRRGRVADRDGDSVDVSIAEGQGRYRLRGPARLALHAGRAVFEQTRLVEDGNGPHSGFVTLRLASSGMPPIESARIIAGGDAQTLRLRSGILNGQGLTPGILRITLTPSNRIRGTVDIRFTTDLPPAALLLAAIPTWGDRRSNFVTLRAMPSQAANDSARVTLDLSGPARRGRYYVVLAVAAETEARFIASATNWLVGSPRWFDGNDLADLRPDQADSINRQGAILWPWTYPRNDDPAKAAVDSGRPVPSVFRERQRVHINNQRIPAIAIEIVVQ